MSEFFVGQKIVCIDNSAYADDISPSVLSTECIYTVRWLGGFNFADGEKIGLKVAEVRRPFPTLPDCPFSHRRFRPLESKAVSLFRKIARDVTEGRKLEIVQ